jgi:FMN phosphatase YigB (HAD superfamily)
MASRGPFRAVSLDMWFTIVSYPPEADTRWNEDRVRALVGVLRSKTGERFSASEIESAMERVGVGPKSGTVDPVLVSPQQLVIAYAEALGAEFIVPSDRAARIYSDAGMAEHPPLVNPEVSRLLRGLESRNIPAIAITNTARQEQSWQDFLRSHGNLHLRHIVTSCEVGRAKPDTEIFLTAARRVGLPPGEILHVGDRWDLDVEGAQRAGFGAALYRGLWSSYPPGEERSDEPSLPRDPSVLRVDRLEELLDGDLFVGEPSPG